jgi:hypothetical protein
MGLQNLVGISLEQTTPVKETVKRLLDAAARHIADAKVQAISAETRFSSAYTAIRMLADVGLHAHGYRTLTSRPGHHQTAIQTLPTTLGNDSQTLRQGLMCGRGSECAWNTHDVRQGASSHYGESADR